MVTLTQLKETALAFAETSEEPHFEKTSFRVCKKIFATYNQKENRACIKLSPIDQNVFASFDKNIFVPVPNKWGLQGWTLVYLALVPKEMFVDALTCAYNQVAPKRLRVMNHTP